MFSVRPNNNRFVIMFSTSLYVIIFSYSRCIPVLLVVDISKLCNECGALLSREIQESFGSGRQCGFAWSL